MKSRHIRITSRPIGEAPEWVRDAWIGLVLPTKTGFRRWRTVGVLSGPQGFVRQVFAVLMGQTKTVPGFVVGTKDAVQILRSTRPDAADWWIENTAPLLNGTGLFVFDAECCEPAD